MNYLCPSCGAPGSADELLEPWIFIKCKSCFMEFQLKTGIAHLEKSRRGEPIFDRYKEYLASERWKTLSEAVKARAEHRCQVCNSGGELHVHHRSYERRELPEEIFDLVALCKKCHELFHGL